MTSFIGHRLRCKALLNGVDMVFRVKASNDGEDEPADDFERAVRKAAEAHVLRIQAAFDIGVERLEPGAKSELGSVVKEAGLTDEQEREYASALGHVADGLSQVFQAGVSGTHEFSFEVDDEEVATVVTRALKSMSRSIRRPRRSSEAAKAALLLMAGSLETFVADIADVLVSESPETISLSSKSLTLGQYAQLGTFEAARDVVAAQSIETLMHGGIDDWAKWFALYKIDWKSIPGDWWSFREIDARRNLVAHANGIVNGVYTRLAREAGAVTIPELHKKLELDREYLQHARDELASFGILIAASTAMKWRPAGLARTYKWAAGEARSLVEEGAYAAGQMVVAKLLEVAKSRLPRSLEMHLRVTRWLALKELGGVEAIRSDVEAYEFAGLALELEHYQAVLLDDDETARRQILTLISRGELTRTAVRILPEYQYLLTRGGTGWLEVDESSAKGEAN